MGSVRVYTYKFTNGEVITSRLEKDELMERMNRLDTLRVLTEGYTEGHGKSICKKAVRAYNKVNDFTGIIRLSIHEKDFIGYLLESEFNDEEDKEVLNFYLK